MAEWEFSDAWFATAVAWCGRWSRDLSHVIGAADALNHDILGRDEIQQAVSRLVGAGLLLVEDGNFKLTRAGRAILKKRRGRGTEQAQSVLGLLAPIAVHPADWHVSEDQVRVAYEAYVERVKSS